MSTKEWKCDCWKYCKYLKDVSRMTYYDHAKYCNTAPTHVRTNTMLNKTMHTHLLNSWPSKCRRDNDEEHAQQCDPDFGHYEERTLTADLGRHSREPTASDAGPSSANISASLNENATIFDLEGLLQNDVTALRMELFPDLTTGQADPGCLAEDDNGTHTQMMIPAHGPDPNSSTLLPSVCFC
ncbi:hypothetical protein AcV5_002665 [Taiwanofungus camphoratus]|nr:hypothetical protein AcV5_002665 [Antrodia cinnamomea]